MSLVSLSEHLPFIRCSVRKDSLILTTILLLSLVQGLLYLVLVPPGQHYDEPGNFEYVWLVAHRDTWPQPGDYDQNMRRELLTELIRTDFFRGMPVPSLDPNQGPLWIGLSQVGDPPLYYLLASIPLRIFPQASVVTQLYLARGVSLFLYLITIFAAAMAVRELFSSDNPLRWMVPLTLALIPGFTDLMTSINNDVGAVAAFTIWLWLAIRFLLHRAKLPEVLLLFIATFACFLMKKTVWIAVPLLLPLFILALIKRPWRWVVLAGTFLVSMIALLVLFPSRDAAEWFRYTNQSLPTRVETTALPFTNNAVQIQVNPGPQREALYQPLGSEINQIKGKVITIAAWMWSTKETTIQAPGLSYIAPNQQEVILTHPVNIGPTPQFIASHYDLPDLNTRYNLLLDPSDPPDGSQPVVYYSGIILANGMLPTNQPPIFTTRDGNQGIWGGTAFRNLARNTFVANKWPSPRTDFVNIIAPRLNLGSIELTQVIDTLLDFRYTSWYFRMTAVQIFETFWAKFGWAQIRLTSKWAYYVLLVFTLAGVLGGLIAAIRHRRMLNFVLLTFGGLVLASVAAFAVLYNLTYASVIFHAFIPVARYIFPAILLIAIILNIGWLELTSLALPGRQNSRLYAYSVYTISFLVLDLYSLYSLVYYVRGS